MHDILLLRGREHDPKVARLLELAQIHRYPHDAIARGPQIEAEYANASDLQLYGCLVEGEIVGVIGIQPISGSRALIRDLAVVPEARQRQIGRGLIDHLRDTLHFDAFEGDTIQSAVGFYEHCGFTVSAHGVMNNGETRYRFYWRR